MRSTTLSTLSPHRDRQPRARLAACYAHIFIQPLLKSLSNACHSMLLMVLAAVARAMRDNIHQIFIDMPPAHYDASEVYGTNCFAFEHIFYQASYFTYLL
jgi:hypothetical protein